MGVPVGEATSRSSSGTRTGSGWAPRHHMFSMPERPSTSTLSRPHPGSVLAHALRPGAERQRAGLQARSASTGPTSRSG